MERRLHAMASDPGHALVECFAVNDRMNQVVLEYLDPRAWQAKPPGERTRTIAATFSHVHNIRRKWLRLSAPHLKLPASLEARCSQEAARAALAESAARCCEMLDHALVQADSRVATFRRDGWAGPWPACTAMAAYMIAHDAHHRGQVCMLAHQLGFRLPASVTSRMWGWERLWKPQLRVSSLSSGVVTERPRKRN